MLDWGFLSRKHRALQLKNTLKLYGLATKIFSAIVVDNDYAEVFPEAETVYAEDIGLECPPFQTCRILMDRPIDGLLIDGNTLSITDKVETQFTITTDAVLQLEDKLEVTYPDGKTLNLRVVERLTKHPMTTIDYKYVCVVL